MPCLHRRRRRHCVTTPTNVSRARTRRRRRAKGLNYSGVVNIKWSKVEDKAKSLLDANGDNKLDKEDAKALWKRVKAALTTNLPAGGGFSGGFALGLCCG